MRFNDYINTTDDGKTAITEVHRVLKETYLTNNALLTSENEVLDSWLIDVLRANIAQTLVNYNLTAPNNLKIIVSQELIQIDFDDIRIVIFVYVVLLSDITNPNPSIGVVQI